MKYGGIWEYRRKGPKMAAGENIKHMEELQRGKLGKVGKTKSGPCQICAGVNNINLEHGLTL